jgi:hypothetical protein
MTIATAPTEPRLTEKLAALASDTRVRQLAPPFLGEEPGITRRRFAWPTPPNTWTATRIDLAGRIVSQLGSRPSDTFNLRTTEAGYQIEQRVRPGYNLWTASVQVISVSRLPATRVAVSGFLGVNGVPRDFQALVPGRTQLFTVARWVPEEAEEPTVRLRCGVHLMTFFGPGQSAYAEGIVQVQSIVHHVPPSPTEPDAARSQRELEEGEVEEAEAEVIADRDDEVERIGGFDE